MHPQDNSRSPHHDVADVDSVWNLPWVRRFCGLSEYRLFGSKLTVAMDVRLNLYSATYRNGPSVLLSRKPQVVHGEGQV